MLENDYYNYVTEVFSYIEDGNILWANHQFYNINYEEKSEGDFFSALSFIQRHDSLMTFDNPLKYIFRCLNYFQGLRIESLNYLYNNFPFRSLRFH